jgi:hypothetical protein
MNAKLGELAKAWFDLEVAHPSLSMSLVANLSDATASYHGNGKHEAMVELFKELTAADHMKSYHIEYSFIEEACIEHDLVAVFVCDECGLQYTLNVNFDGGVDKY